ncbi:putative Serine/threonine-protein phosphatase 6 regulatory ankyrin repeat subunit B [Glarea lozoyensis 74030]|uniref:Putative Serine/threonine-protein phosphatase 6 regulatory ankyrin repeat subunit B n=1 Tax=Glarea lozoyensis (strain ATCC 74030 / MF5533) TaxID=1104152 RepID=H0EUF0_GLAL7|nr:putative Serine/threonine-protein phosphatase 6 regulatory ankyrin repeat subunit B [Glarea lozoyensis 74030]
MVSEILKNARSLASTPDLAGRIPLHYAVMNQSKDTKGLSPLHKEKLSSGDYWGMTALHFASIEGRKPIVKLLLDCEARISAQNRFDRTALHLAVAKIDVGVVAELLRKDDANKATKARDKNNKTALQIAAELKRNADEEFAQASSDKQSVEDKLNKPAKTPIQAEEQESRQKLTRQLNEYKNYISTHTSEQNVLKKIIKSLLQKEDLKVSGGKMLLWAAKERLNTTFELLMDEGVEVGEIDVLTGETVLHFAAKVGSSDMVEKLLPRRDPNDARPPATVNESSSVEIVNRPDGTNTTALILGAIGGYSKIVDLLLKAGANPKAVDQNERTALSWAVEKGQVTIVKRLLDEPEMNPNIVDGKPPRLLLARAAENGNLAMAKLLCVKGANVDSKSDSAHTPIFWAVINGHQEIVAYFLRATAKPDVNEIDKFSNYTLLSEAVNAGHLKIVEQLIDAGADVQKQSGSSRETALSYAARLGRKEIRKEGTLKHAGGYDDLVFLLLTLGGADLESKDESGRTPIIWAALEGETTTVKLLSRLNANIESQDEDLRTSLSWAASEGNIAVVDVLLENTAEIESRDKSGPKSQEYVVKRLLDAKASVLSTDYDGRNPLSWATSLGSGGVVRLLLQQDPVTQIETQDSKGLTALHRAVECGANDPVELILNAEPNLNIKDKNQETPLGLGARKDDESVVLQLLEADANPNVQDHLGRTPLFSAIHSDHDTAALRMLDNELDTEKHPTFSPTPLQAAVFQYSYEVVDKLLTRGADVSGMDIQGRTAIHIAAVEGPSKRALTLRTTMILFLKYMTTLMDKAGMHFTMDQPDNDGWTPLHWAAKAGDKEVVQLFLDAGADPNLKEKLNNWSPLGVAQYHDRHSVVETLIKYFEARKEEMSSGVVLPGRADFSKFCDGCRIGPIYGPVFSCTFCDDFDFCYNSSGVGLS